MKDKDNLKCKILSQQWLILLLAISLISVLTALENPGSLMLNNAMGTFEQTTVLDLVAVGTTIPVISGNFDISVGAVIGLNSYLITMMMNVGISVPVVATADILTTTFYTFFSGVLTILFKAPSFIISLAATNVYIGAALYLTEGAIQTVCGGLDAMNRFRLLGAVPLISIINLTGCVVVDIILQCTQTGRHIFTIGSSEKAVFLSDIKMARNKLILSAMSDFPVSLATVLLLSRVGSALPSTGAGCELQAMGAVVTDGAPINSGKGNIIGAFFGVLLMGLISSVLNVLGVNSYLQEITSDALIIISLGISAIRVHILTKS